MAAIRVLTKVHRTSRLAHRGLPGFGWRNGKLSAERFYKLVSSFASESGLSGQQGVVLRLALDGRSVKEMSGDLKCHYRTVQTHWMRLCQKLDCRSRDEAVAAFVRWALAKLPPDPSSSESDKSERPDR